MRWLLMLVMSLALGACGSAATTDVKINRSPSEVYMALSQSSTGELGKLLPELVVQRTSPGDMEILYTIPKSADGEEASIHFMLEPLGGGKATMVSATIDVPAVKAKVNGVLKVLSAAKVGNEIRKMLDRYARNGDAAAVQRELSAMLGGIALSANARLAQKAFDGTLAAEAVEDMIQGFADAVEGGDPAVSDDSDWAGGTNEQPAVEEPSVDEAGFGDGKFEGDAGDAAAQDAASAATSAATAAAEAAAGKEGSDWGN